MSYERIEVDGDIRVFDGSSQTIDYYSKSDIYVKSVNRNVVVDSVTAFGKTAPFTLSVVFPIFCLTTFKNNGGQIFLAANTGTATVATRGILVKRTSSGAI